MMIVIRKEIKHVHTKQNGFTNDIEPAIDEGGSSQTFMGRTKYISLCVPCGLCHSQSDLSLWHGNGHRQYGRIMLLHSCTTFCVASWSLTLCMYFCEVGHTSGDLDADTRTFSLWLPSPWKCVPGVPGTLGASDSDL